MEHRNYGNRMLQSSSGVCLDNRPVTHVRLWACNEFELLLWLQVRREQLELGPPEATGALCSCLFVPFSDKEHMHRITNTHKHTHTHLHTHQVRGQWA
jgi:hypothetical protein